MASQNGPTAGSRFTLDKHQVWRGDYVQTLFDTGAFGYTSLYGIVEKAGVRTYTVRWESGLRNRIRQGNRNVSHIKPDDVPTEAVSRLRNP